MNVIVEKPGMGWLPDYPDFRDYTTEGRAIKSMLTTIGADNPLMVNLPVSTDLRFWCSPIVKQGSLGSCTANAGVGLVEYFERRAYGNHIEGSRLFLYKTTRNILHSTGDTGAFLRSTMGALVLFGVPPEEFWPYIIADFDKEPSAFCYAYAQNYQTINYYRLDPPKISPEELLIQIKTNLAAGLPAMFGFTVYSSYLQANTTGKIPFPSKGEKIVGGHAMVVVGYDDQMKIKNSNQGGGTTKGAFLIRNSWGAQWGMDGYGWFPYEYVLSGLARDWWSLLKNEWVDTGEFKVE